jgi:hypothetical protein
MCAFRTLSRLLGLAVALLPVIAVAQESGTTSIVAEDDQIFADANDFVLRNKDIGEVSLLNLATQVVSTRGITAICTFARTLPTLWVGSLSFLCNGRCCTLALQVRFTNRRRDPLRLRLRNQHSLVERG